MKNDLLIKILLVVIYYNWSIKVVMSRHLLITDKDSDAIENIHEGFSYYTLSLQEGKDYETAKNEVNKVYLILAESDTEGEIKEIMKKIRLENVKSILPT